MRRAKSPRVAGSWSTLIGVMHALPLTYGKDMQEDKEPLFDAIDTVESCLEACEGMLGGLVFDRDRMAEASGDEMLAATEIADLLVRRGVPFREAHGIVGDLVRDAVEGGKSLSELSAKELRERSEHLDDSYYAVLRRSNSTGSDARAITIGELEVDATARVVTLRGLPVELTPREFDLLHYLAARAGRVVSKRELLTEVWQLPYGGADKTVDVHLSWLRRKLGETAQQARYLHSVRGVGVRIAAPDGE